MQRCNQTHLTLDYIKLQEFCAFEAENKCLVVLKINIVAPTWVLFKNDHKYFYHISTVTIWMMSNFTTQSNEPPTAQMKLKNFQVDLQF